MRDAQNTRYIMEFSFFFRISFSETQIHVKSGRVFRLHLNVVDLRDRKNES